MRGIAVLTVFLMVFAVVFTFSTMFNVGVQALLVGSEVQITTDPNYQYDPQIDGPYIVWTDNRNGTNDVYLYNITSGVETPIANSTENEYFNDISGDLVVYTLSRFDDDDIFVYNITSGETKQITDPENREFARRRNPAIHGKEVVWQDNRSGNYDIYCYDLGTDTEFIVSLGSTGFPAPGDQVNPKIHGDIVVWEDRREPDNPDIYLIDLSNLGAVSVLIPADDRLPLPPDVTAWQAHPDIYGRYVVFDEARSDDATNHDIVLWDLDTNTAIWKTLDARAQERPRIDGTRIVWEDSRNGNLDIYTYDVATGNMDPVTTDPNMQFLCAISGNRIVWTDLRNADQENPTNYDIYMFEIEALPTPIYTLTIHGSPSGVTFTVDGVPQTTPWSGTYDEDNSVSLEMPETQVVDDARYYWDRWSDGESSRSRTVTMTTDITLTGQYAGPYYELTVSSSPITGITFTIDGAPQTTPYTEWLPEGSYTLEMPETHDGYIWSHWLEDGDTNRIKTITLPGTTWTGVFVTAPPPTPPSCVGGEMVLIHKTNLTPSRWTPPLIVFAFATMLATAISAVYIKHRKKQ